MFLSDEIDTIYHSIVGKDGTIISGDTNLPMPDVIMRPGASTIYDGIFRGQKVRIASVSLLPPGLPPDQSVLIQVAETLNKGNKLAGEIITAMVLPHLLLIVLAALIVWVGIGKGLAPLEKLIGKIAACSHRDLSPVEDSNIPEEVRPIIHEINELMGRSGKTIEAQQRFITDAAHQLRTPLSGLKTQTDLALRQSDPVSLQHSLERLNTSADRTIRLINKCWPWHRSNPALRRYSI